MPSWKPVPQRCAGASMPGSGPLDMLISEIPLPSEFVMFFFLKRCCRLQLTVIHPVRGSWHGNCNQDSRSRSPGSNGRSLPGLRWEGVLPCAANSRAWIPGLYLAFTLLHLATKGLWQHDATRSAPCSSRCWQSSLVFIYMKMVRIRWKCIRHIFGLRTPGRSNRNLKSLEVSWSLSCSVCLASPGTAFAHGQRRWGQNWGSRELSGSGNPQQRWKKWAAGFRWMQHIYDRLSTVVKSEISAKLFCWSFLIRPCNPMLNQKSATFQRWGEGN